MLPSSSYVRNYGRLKKSRTFLAKKQTNSSSVLFDRSNNDSAYKYKELMNFVTDNSRIKKRYEKLFFLSLLNKVSRVPWVPKCLSALRVSECPKCPKCCKCQSGDVPLECLECSSALRLPQVLEIPSTFSALSAHVLQSVS